MVDAEVWEAPLRTIERGLDMAKNLLQFAKKRSTIEDDAARRILRLKITDLQDIAPEGEIDWKIISSLFSTEVQLSTKFINFLNNELCASVEGLIIDIEKKQKQILQNITNIDNELKDAADRKSKAKAAKDKEAEIFNLKSPPSSGTIGRKMSRALPDQKFQFVDLEAEFQEAEENFNKLQLSCYTEKFPGIFNELSQLQKSLYHLLKRNLAKFVTIYQETTAEFSVAVSSASEKVAKMEQPPTSVFSLNSALVTSPSLERDKMHKTILKKLTKKKVSEPLTAINLKDIVASSTGRNRFRKFVEGPRSVFWEMWEESNLLLQLEDTPEFSTHFNKFYDKFIGNQGSVLPADLKRDATLVFGENSAKFLRSLAILRKISDHCWDFLNSQVYDEFVKSELYTQFVTQQSRAKQMQVLMNRVFKVELSEIMNRQKSDFPELPVPYVVNFLMQEIMSRDAIHTEGIFRISGTSAEIQALKSRIDSGNYVVLPTDGIHDITGVFKLWFRELPILIPTSLYGSLMSSSQDAQAVLNLISGIPDFNLKLLRGLAKFLRDFLKEEVVAVTKMTLENLCVVFSPCLLRPPTGYDPVAQMAEMDNARRISAILIQKLPEISWNSPTLPLPDFSETRDRSNSNFSEISFDYDRRESTVSMETSSFNLENSSFNLNDSGSSDSLDQLNEEVEKIRQILDFNLKDTAVVGTLGEITVNLHFSSPDNLIVELISCQFSRNSKIDSFVKLKLGKQKKRSKIVKKSGNPTFRERFELKVNSGDKLLHLSAWSGDLLGKELLGCASIGIKEGERSYPLSLDPTFQPLMALCKEIMTPVKQLESLQLEIRNQVEDLEQFKLNNASVDDDQKRLKEEMLSKLKDFRQVELEKIQVEMDEWIKSQEKQRDEIRNDFQDEKYNFQVEIQEMTMVRDHLSQEVFKLKKNLENSQLKSEVTQTEENSRAQELANQLENLHQLESLALNLKEAELARAETDLKIRIEKYSQLEIQVEEFQLEKSKAENEIRERNRVSNSRRDELDQRESNLKFQLENLKIQENKLKIQQLELTENSKKFQTAQEERKIQLEQQQTNLKIQLENFKEKEKFQLEKSENQMKEIRKREVQISDREISLKTREDELRKLLSTSASTSQLEIQLQHEIQVEKSRIVQLEDEVSKLRQSQKDLQDSSRIQLENFNLKENQFKKRTEELEMRMRFRLENQVEINLKLEEREKEVTSLQDQLQLANQETFKLKVETEKLQLESGRHLQNLETSQKETERKLQEISKLKQDLQDESSRREVEIFKLKAELDAKAEEVDLQVQKSKEKVQSAKRGPRSSSNMAIIGFALAILIALMAILYNLKSTSL